MPSGGRRRGGRSRCRRRSLSGNGARTRTAPYASRRCGATASRRPAATNSAGDVCGRRSRRARAVRAAARRFGGVFGGSRAGAAAPRHVASRRTRALGRSKLGPWRRRDCRGGLAALRPAGDSRRNRGAAATSRQVSPRSVAATPPRRSDVPLRASARVFGGARMASRDATRADGRGRSVCARPATPARARTGGAAPGGRRRRAARVSPRELRLARPGARRVDRGGRTHRRGRR